MSQWVLWGEIRKTTQEKNKPLPQKEFEWCPSENVSGENKKTTRIAFFLKTLKCVQPKRQVGFEKILEGVKSKELYGFLIVDIHTPNDLKYFCQDFPPIIKNKNISREDIDVYMRKVAEQHDLLKRPKKYLISSYFEKKI